MNDAKRYQLYLEYQNGFGIQFPTPTDDIVPICLINERFELDGTFIKVDYKQLNSELKNETKANSLQCGGYCGKAYLKLDFSN